MAERLSDKGVRDIAPPEKGQRLVFDSVVSGLAVRVLRTGARAFVFNYRVHGRERRLTIGSPPAWTVAQARDRAGELRRSVDVGGDPMQARQDARKADDVNALADRFEAEHLAKRRASTSKGYLGMLRHHIRPALGRMKVADVRHEDVDRLHRKIAATAPYQANRTIAVLSKMFGLAVKWGLRADNPVKGIERAPEEKRERFLTPAEIAKLGEILAAHPERRSCNAIRLLLLTGARRGEMLSATWSQFDLEKGVWTKPSAATKQAKEHRIPLSAPAMALLSEMRAAADPTCPYVFPGQRKADARGRPVWAHLTDIKRVWASVCEAAGIEGVRVHDLRHSYASILASSGLSLPIIGALLGHTQPQTTARYAHLLDDPLRAATERVGAVVTGAGQAGADLVPMRRSA